MVAALMAVAVILPHARSAFAATRYWLNPTQTVPHGDTDHCFTQYGPSSWTDLLPAPPTGARSSTSTGAVLFGCTPAFPLGASLGAGTGTLDVWFTNTFNKSRKPKPCTVPWFLQHNAVPNNVGDTITGTTLNGNPGITVPANTTTPTPFTVNFNVPATTLGQNDQLMLWIDIRTQTGPCSQMTLYWGSASTPTDLSLPTLSAEAWEGLFADAS